MLTLLLACATTPEPAPEPAVSPVPVPGPMPNWTAPAPQISELDNGGTLWVLADSDLPLVSLRIVFPGGAATDPEESPGAAYMAGLLMEEGAPLRAQWQRELQAMRDRIRGVRAALRAELERVRAGGEGRSWAHITEQRGMFALAGLSPRQCEWLCDHSVYLPRSGRICVAALSVAQCPALAEAIRRAIDEC